MIAAKNYPLNQKEYLQKIKGFFSTGLNQGSVRTVNMWCSECFLPVGKKYSIYLRICCNGKALILDARVCTCIYRVTEPYLYLVCMSVFVHVCRCLRAFMCLCLREQNTALLASIIRSLRCERGKNVLVSRKVIRIQIKPSDTQTNS